MTRYLVLGSILVLSTQMMGCSQSTSGPNWSLLSNGLGGPVEAAEDMQEKPGSLHEPTVANKTLSAMALERATGLKPVPSRLVNFD